MGDNPWCVMFAGQSVQERGMGAQLWKRAPSREVLELLKRSLGDDLEYLMTAMPDPELAKTYNAQRAIHAHHVANWVLYRRLRPETELRGAVGHSMGVVAALVAAEAMTVEDSGIFIRARAQAFSDVCAAFPEPQGMAAVSSEELDAALDEVKAFPGVALALHNTATKAVIGGAVKDLEAFAAKAAAEDWPLRIKLLKVEGPYHTSAFKPCREPLQAALERIRIQSPRVPVFMGTSGKKETEPSRIKELLVDQAESRELHLDAVRAAYADGCRDFLEVAYRPQPITWLRDQLTPDQAASITASAVSTEELSA